MSILLLSWKKQNLNIATPVSNDDVTEEPATAVCFIDCANLLFSELGSYDNIARQISKLQLPDDLTMTRRGKEMSDDL